MEAAIWGGDELGTQVTTVFSTGHDALDGELPGGDWPSHSLTEVLCPQPSTLEWRFLGPALRQVAADGRQIVVIGSPKLPHRISNPESVARPAAICNHRHRLS